MKLTFYAASQTVRNATLVAIDALKRDCTATSAPTRSAAGICAIEVVDVKVRDQQIITSAAVKAGAWMV